MQLGVFCKTKKHFVFMGIVYVDAATKCEEHPHGLREDRGSISNLANTLQLCYNFTQGEFWFIYMEYICNIFSTLL